MKIREKVLLTVEPQYGFGAKGLSGDDCSVPPNAKLLITLKLLSLQKVTFDKTVLKEGEGYECPDEGAVVKLKLIGMLQNGTVFMNKGHGDDQAQLFEFKTDEKQVIDDGLDKAVMTMKKGEVALLTIAPEYAFGSSESHQELAVVPPNSALNYEVELVSFVKAMKFIEDLSPFSLEEAKKVWDLKCWCRRRIEACQTKLEDYEREEKIFKFQELKRKSLINDNRYGGWIRMM